MTGLHGFCFPCGATRALEGANGKCLICKARLLTETDSDVELENPLEAPQPAAKSPQQVAPTAAPADEELTSATVSLKYIQ